MEIIYKLLSSQDKLIKVSTNTIQLSSSQFTINTLTSTDAQYKYYANLFYNDSLIKQANATTQYTSPITVINVDRSSYKNKLNFQGLLIKTGSTVLFNYTASVKQTTNTNTRMLSSTLMSGSTQMGTLFNNYGSIILYGSYPQATVTSGSSSQITNNQIYFVRAYNNQFNDSDNTTWTSSVGCTYITSIGLYDSNDNLLAVARTSLPIKKTDQSQVNIKIKLIK